MKRRLEDTGIFSKRKNFYITSSLIKDTINRMLPPAPAIFLPAFHMAGGIGKSQLNRQITSCGVGTILYRTFLMHANT